MRRWHNSRNMVGWGTVFYQIPLSHRSIAWRIDNKIPSKYYYYCFCRLIIHDNYLSVYQQELKLYDEICKMWALHTKYPKSGRNKFATNCIQHIQRDVWHAVVTEKYLSVNAISILCAALREYSIEPMVIAFLSMNVYFLQCIRNLYRLFVSVPCAVRCLLSSNEIDIFRITPNPGRARYRIVRSLSIQRAFYDRVIWLSHSTAEWVACYVDYTRCMNYTDNLLLPFQAHPSGSL